ncbi:putative syntaxin of plants SYP7 [Paratrimastix pyriformis]|uniref:Syntaxin of plants SYP7 n=1 Tax=Paratrimastix pyriformis TaxID=342808 RepID=A0ABQ8UWP0_9EUKA|nr:putative syntaxin of plants SYP7 [Paratrimastix pyriformis]
MSYRSEIDRLKKRLAALNQLTMTEAEKEGAKRNKFQNQRKEVIKYLSDLRDLIRDRDQILAASHAPTPESIKMNAQIRSKKVKVRDCMQDIEKEIRDAANKNPGKKQLEVLKAKADFLHLLREQYQCVEEMDAAHRVDASSDAHDELTAGGVAPTTAAARSSGSLTGALGGAVPGRGGRSTDVGLDRPGSGGMPSRGFSAAMEVDAGGDQAWQELIDKDQHFVCGTLPARSRIDRPLLWLCRLQDELLDQIEAGVAQLMNIALSFKAELKKQDALLDLISTKIDKTTKGVEEVNAKTEKALQLTKSSSWCLRIVLLMVALAIVGYILQAFVFK